MAPEDSSAVVGTLTSVDEISPLAVTVLPEGIRWYLVKTETDAIAWRRQNDSAAAKKLDNFFKALLVETSLLIRCMQHRPLPGLLPGAHTYRTCGNEWFVDHRSRNVQ